MEHYNQDKQCDDDLTTNLFEKCKSIDPIIDVTVLPSLNDAKSNVIYRLPSNELWIVSQDQSSWVLVNQKEAGDFVTRKEFNTKVTGITERIDGLEQCCVSIDELKDDVDLIKTDVDSNGKTISNLNERTVNLENLNQQYPNIYETQSASEEKNEQVNKRIDELHTNINESNFIMRPEFEELKNSAVTNITTTNKDLLEVVETVNDLGGKSFELIPKGGNIGGLSKEELISYNRSVSTTAGESAVSDIPLATRQQQGLLPAFMMSTKIPSHIILHRGAGGTVNFEKFLFKKQELQTEKPALLEVFNLGHAYINAHSDNSHATFIGNVRVPFESDKIVSVNNGWYMSYGLNFLGTYVFTTTSKATYLVPGFYNIRVEFDKIYVANKLVAKESISGLSGHDVVVRMHDAKLYNSNDHGIEGRDIRVGAKATLSKETFPSRPSNVEVTFKLSLESYIQLS